LNIEENNPRIGGEESFLEKCFLLNIEENNPHIGGGKKREF